MTSVVTTSIIGIGILIVTQFACSTAQTGDPVVDEGLNGGLELAKAVAEIDFKGTMGKLLKLGGPFLGAVGPVVGLLGELLGFGQESAELQFLREMLATITNRFDRIDGRLDEIAQKIDWTQSKIQFYTYERKILGMKIALERLYNTGNRQDFDGFKEQYINLYESTYEESGKLLYSHIVSKDFTFAGNLLEETIKGNNYDRRDVQNFMLGLTKLILTASQIELVYYKIKFPASLKALEMEWENNIKDMQNKMVKADEEVVNNFKNVALNDAKKILRDNKGMPYSDVGDKIYEHLTDKFYWRNWLVVVYDDVTGSHLHQIIYCGGGHEFRYSGFNLMLASSDKNAPKLNHIIAKSFLTTDHDFFIDAVDIYDIIFKRKMCLAIEPGWISYFVHIMSGRTCERMDCINESAFGVIINGPPYIKSASERVVTNKVSLYTTFVFN